ncbi:MAG: hypothetical protein ACPHWU_03280, partial [Marinobacter vinifirmus]
SPCQRMATVPMEREEGELAINSSAGGEKKRSIAFSYLVYTSIGPVAGVVLLQRAGYTSELNFPARSTVPIADKAG